MPKLLKTLNYLVVGTSFFILIGAGHGIIPMIMVEGVVLHGIIFSTNSFINCFGLTCNYDSSVAVAAMAILLGQFVALISNSTKIALPPVFGIMTMLTGFLYLCHNFFNDSISSFSFYTGLPFFTLSMITLSLQAIQTFRNCLKSDEQTI